MHIEKDVGESPKLCFYYQVKSFTPNRWLKILLEKKIKYVNQFSVTNYKA